MSRCTSRFLALIFIATIVIVGRPLVAEATETFTFQHENVLGTSLELIIDADNQAAAAAAEARVLAEIERSAKIFSGYDADSEFSRWQRRPIGEAIVVSPPLFNVLSAAERYRVAAGGAFHAGAELLTRVWQRAEKSGAAPSEGDLSSAVAKLNQAPWRLDVERSTAMRLVDVPLSLNAIAKGAILDAACRATIDPAAGVRGAVVNIGGDLRASGEGAHPVAIADPERPAVNVEPLARIHLRDRAVATSGGYHRGFQVGERRYSHILDPRSGRPVDHVLSATVVADTALEADALATTFCVLSPERSAALAATLRNVEFYLVVADGRTIASRGWRRLTAAPPVSAAGIDETTMALADTNPPAATEAAAPNNSAAPLLDLVVDFELARPAGAQYRRPYVAMWLEDKDEFPVRTAVLWMQTQQPGPRWHRDLLRWYRNDRIRKLADGTDLIGTVSSATRTAGKYQAIFDGKDDSGKPLPAGEYTLFIEAAREHGTCQLIRKKLTLGAEPTVKTELKPNVEIKAAAFEYKARPADGSK